MADVYPRSYLRESHRPRAVDAGYEREKPKAGNRRHRDADDRGQHRSKRGGSHRSSKKDSTCRQEHSDSFTAESFPERPSFELDVIGQPLRRVVLGVPVETSVMISLRLPTPNRKISAASVDISRLFAAVSLVADNRSGECMPLEAGLLAGQKMFDSVHAVPNDCTARLMDNQPCRVPLGYFSFPGLLVRQSGSYRLRTTLIEMGISAESGGTSILAVDSGTFRVEGRSGGPRRRR